jgi:hypothetical protein
VQILELHGKHQLQCIHVSPCFSKGWSRVRTRHTTSLRMPICGKT